MYDDDDLLPLSALQHLLFCERQCALIHVEQAWAENSFTAEGRLLHERAHSEKGERRPGKKKEFGMPIRSLELGLIGKTDAVEYGDDGSTLVVEYKRGKPKRGREDEVQLCAQALCLEEMRGTCIQSGVLYYGKTKRRKEVAFDNELRALVTNTAQRLHELVASGKTIIASYEEAKCAHCSLLELCIPACGKRVRSVTAYVERMTKEAEP
ncbi:MAG: CRISPR-associated protein Cas4 [Spirochaetota bacterium]